MSDSSAIPTLSRARQAELTAYAVHHRHPFSILKTSQSTDMRVSFRRTTPMARNLQRLGRPIFIDLNHSSQGSCHPSSCELKPPPSLSAALPVRVVRRDRSEPERPMWVPFVGPKRTKASRSRRQRSIGSVPRRHRPDQRVFARLRSCLCFPARPTCYPSRSPSSG